MRKKLRIRVSGGVQKPMSHILRSAVNSRFDRKRRGIEVEVTGLSLIKTETRLG